MKKSKDYFIAIVKIIWAVIFLGAVSLFFLPVKMWEKWAVALLILLLVAVVLSLILLYFSVKNSGIKFER